MVMAFVPRGERLPVTSGAVRVFPGTFRPGAGRPPVPADAAPHGMNAYPALEVFPERAILRWADILPPAFGANELHFT